MSPGKVKTLIAILGALIGFAGIYINLIDQGEDKPNLILEIERIELGSSLMDRNFLDDLTEIEELYGAVTADKIHDLMKEIKQIDFRAKDNQESLKNFSASLQSTIKFFVSEFKPWTINDIEYKNGVILWPDGIDYDLLNDDRVEMNFPNLIDEIRAHPNSLDLETIQRIKMEAFNLYKPPSEQTFEDRKNVTARLRSIREAIQRLINRENLKITVKLNVMNKSRLPNFIKSKAILRVHKEDSVFKDIDLMVQSNAIVQGYGFSALVFESEPSSKLDQETKEILKDQFGPIYEYSLFIEDSNGIIWYSGDDYSLTGQLKNQDFLEKVNEMFYKLIE